MDLNLYLSNISLAYCQSNATELFDGRIPLTEDIINRIANETGLGFILTKDPEANVCMANNKEVRPEFRQHFSSIDVLDYIYAVLHSSNFRTNEKQFQETNFQFPKNAEIFWSLSLLGSKIKQIHSLENIKTENFITEFAIEGNCIVRNPNYINSSPKEGNYDRVYINETQYFENVPEAVWNFQTENHHPAQKWLNDRKEQKLNFEDILYYQKIITALSETNRLIKEINEII